MNCALMKVFSALVNSRSETSYSRRVSSLSWPAEADDAEDVAHAPTRVCLELTSVSLIVVQVFLQELSRSRKLPEGRE